MTGTIATQLALIDKKCKFGEIDRNDI
jgi:hypothetical protein